MAQIIFTEGQLAKKIADSGWPSTLSLALSTKPCSGGGAHTAGETVGAADFGEITGTGYTRQTISEPAANSSGTKAWPDAVWATSTATDWSSAVKSVCIIDPTDSKLLAALDLGATRDLSGANTTETYGLDTTQVVV